MDIKLGNRSDITNRFNFVTDADGDIAFDDTCAHEVMTAVMERRNTYWDDAKHGSEVYQLTALTSRTPSQAESMVLDALDPLVRANKIVNPQCAATAVRSNGQLTGRLSVLIKWTTPSGLSQQQTTEL